MKRLHRPLPLFSEGSLTAQVHQTEATLNVKAAQSSKCYSELLFVSVPPTLASPNSSNSADTSHWPSMPLDAVLSSGRGRSISLDQASDGSSVFVLVPAPPPNWSLQRIFSSWSGGGDVPGASGPRKQTLGVLVKQ